MSDVELVRRFRGAQALVIGDAMLDSYLDGSAARLCSEGPVPVVRAAGEQHAPGGAANSAANLRALGADVRFVGVTGLDAPGRQLRAELRRLGVEARWLVEDAAVTTLHKRRIQADGQYVVRVDDGDTQCCSAEGRRRLLANLDDAYAGCEVVVVADYGYGVVDDALLARLRDLRAREARPRPLVIDSKRLRRFAGVGATVVTPNLLEARLLVDGGAERSGAASLEEAERVGRRLLEILACEHVAVTLAADGVLLVSRSGARAHLLAATVARANDVGAGDSFAAALALALAAGAAPADAARVGVEAAGIAISKAGTSVVGQQELLQRVSLRALADGDGEDDALARVAERALVDRLGGRTVVFTNGVFDILHAGHVQFLRQARALGDVLVVGVNSDRSARRLKGPGRPINGERDRLALIAALDAVDHALLFDEDEPSALIRAIRPHAHVKGGDYADAALPEAAAVAEVGGRVVILPLSGGLSTSGLIDRIVSVAAGRLDEAVAHD